MVRVVIVLERESNLLKIIRALHATRGFSSRLNGWEKESDQNTDDSDDDEEFNKREAAPLIRKTSHRKPPFVEVTLSETLVTLLARRWFETVKNIRKARRRNVAIDNLTVYFYYPTF